MRKSLISQKANGLTWQKKMLKRTADILGATTGLFLTGWIILVAFIAASIETKGNGFFMQDRIGKGGRIFKVIKIRTMQPIANLNTTVTTVSDPRITRLGHLFRSLKIDELPQLFNVFLGHMSIVGPRPDVPGYADRLIGKDRIILSVRPGITGPATLRYRNEESLLANVDDSETYSREVIFPEKVRLNREYVENYSFKSDINYIMKTILGN